MSKVALKISGFIILLTVSMVGMGQKTDKAFLKNGDVITGEIKSLKFAKLSFDMTGPGTIQIKWEEILQLKSDKIFQITMRNGEVLIEKLDSFFFVKHHASLHDLVEVVQIKDRFLLRLDGDINLGFNFSKSSDNFQFNLNSSTTYRKPKAETNLKLNSVLSKSSSDTSLSKKQDATINYYRKLKKSFFLNSILGWQQNTQLGLANRFSFSGGGGKILINNNHQRLLTGTGLSYNVEQSSNNMGYTNNLEGLLTIQFKNFRYSSPKISIDASNTFYPGLSDWGRIRMDLQLNTKIEIFKDFFAGLVFYDLYDNRPPKGAVSKNDFGINFTIGYEFGK